MSVHKIDGKKYFDGVLNNIKDETYKIYSVRFPDNVYSRECLHFECEDYYKSNSESDFESPRDIYIWLDADTKVINEIAYSWGTGDDMFTLALSDEEINALTDKELKYYDYNIVTKDDFALFSEQMRDYIISFEAMADDLNHKHEEERRREEEEARRRKEAKIEKGVIEDAYEDFPSIDKDDVDIYVAVDDDDYSFAYEDWDMVKPVDFRDDNEIKLEKNEKEYREREDLTDFDRANIPYFKYKDFLPADYYDKEYITQITESIPSYYNEYFDDEVGDVDDYMNSVYVSEFNIPIEPNDYNYYTEDIVPHTVKTVNTLIIEAEERMKKEKERLKNNVSRIKGENQRIRGDGKRRLPNGGDFDTDAFDEFEPD